MIGPMPDAADAAQHALGRREALRALGLAALAAPLAGCGIRLEDDAPRLPLLPTRQPIPGEQFVVALWARSGRLASAAAELGGAAKTLPAQLASVHAEQARVLRSVLVQQAVPDSVLDDARRAADAEALVPTAGPTVPPGATVPAATPTPTTSSGGSRSPASAGPSAAPTAAPVTPALLGRAEAAALVPDVLAGLARTRGRTLSLAGAALAQRGASATLLGSAPRWPEDAFTDADRAAWLLEATRAAVYGFQVVTAQSAGAQRTLAAGTLAALQGREAEQESLAGASARPRVLGYPLPFPVTTPTAARRLALHVLTGLAESLASELGRSEGKQPQLAALVRWLSDTTVQSNRWGQPVAAFPGMA